MSGSYTYPGVYIQELPSPVHTINGVQTSVTVLVGVATSGPLNEPTPIASVADYLRTFGIGSTVVLPLDRAVSLFYQNGGGAAFIVRIGSATGIPTAVLDSSAQLPEIKAISPGEWGHNLSVTTDQNHIPARLLGSLFNLTVTLTVTDPATGNSQKITEQYAGIPVAPSATRSLQGAVASSNLIQYDPTATPASTPPGTPPPIPPLGTFGFPPPAPAIPPVPPAPPPGDPDLLGNPDLQTGFYAAAKHNTFFNMLVLTPLPDATDVLLTTLEQAAGFAQSQRAMLIVDAPASWGTVKQATDGRDTFFAGFGIGSTNAAVYFPRLQLTDPSGAAIDNVGPSAAIAGLHALTDSQRGVWKAAAGIAVKLTGISALKVKLSDAENGLLNPVAVNCLRALPIIGNVVWGARTMAGDDVSASQWKYIPIRRLALYIEASLYQGTQWVVFEPNDEPLWAQVRLNIGAFMHTLFRQGAFQGSTAKDAYFVKCDKDTNPQADIDRGILNVIVGFAPLKPAEFVVIKIQQIAGQIDV